MIAVVGVGATTSTVGTSALGDSSPVRVLVGDGSEDVGRGTDAATSEVVVSPRSSSVGVLKESMDVLWEIMPAGMTSAGFLSSIFASSAVVAGSCLVAPSEAVAGGSATSVVDTSVSFSFACSGWETSG